MRCVGLAHVLRSLFLLLCVMSWIACGGESKEDDMNTDEEGSGEESEQSEISATFTNVQSQIFQRSCAFASCHGNGSRSAGLNLDAEEGDVYTEIVGSPSTEVSNLDEIEPFSPEESYIFLKITGDDAIEGSQMPLTGCCLSESKIDLMRRWIQAGAPDN